MRIIKMNKWIELHDAAENGGLLINVDNIEGVFIEKIYEDCFVTHIDVVDGGSYCVTETYDEIKEMITG